MAKKNGPRYACTNCGAISPKWKGQCTECGEWNAIEEQQTGPGDPDYQGFSPGSASEAFCQSLAAVSSDQSPRIQTGIDVFDDLVGGGLVPGGISLIGGEPGVGKSTFMLQLASRLATHLKPIVYISGEESFTQIKLRASRLRIGNEEDILLIAEQSLDSALASVLANQPKLLVVDSIQTVFTSRQEGTPGSLAQIRECAAILTRFGKERNLPVIMIGHVTKEGAIAGPKVLEHTVDTVLYFEGELTSQYRLLRVFKNRFGATGEVGVFQMTEKGLLSITNPSDLFVTRNRTDSPGVVIVPLLEGTRCILAEVQTLVTRSFLTMPRRVVSGLDSNRLSLVLAVLEKHGGMRFYNQDVFANVAGGLRLSESGGDLGLAMALIGSLQETPVPSDLLMIGELTLSGEVRPVSGIERRLAEGKRFGFRRFLVPAVAEGRDSGEMIRVRTLKEAIQAVFNRS